jgi:predicted phage gp36 major capsid-like protein
MGQFRKLTDDEIRALREDMRRAGEWAKQELKRSNDERNQNQDHQDKGHG